MNQRIPDERIFDESKDTLLTNFDIIISSTFTALILFFFLVPELGDIPLRDEHSFHGELVGLLRSHGGRDVPG